MKEQGTGVVLRLERTFPVSRERVYRAWTDPEEMKRWKGPEGFTIPVCEVDLRVGGRYRVHMRGPDGTEHRVGGEYREIDPPRRLVFTWRWDTDPPDAETLVTVELTEKGGNTEMVMTHEGFAEEAIRDRHVEGWTSSLRKLERRFQ